MPISLEGQAAGVLSPGAGSKPVPTSWQALILLLPVLQIQKLEPGERTEKYSPAAETAQEF